MTMTTTVQLPMEASPWPEQVPPDLYRPITEKPLVMATIRRLAAQLRNLDHEELYVIDHDGHVTYHGVGTEDRVEAPPLWDCIGRIVIHNHPHHDVTFSGDDLIHLIYDGIHAGVVVTPNQLYIADIGNARFDWSGADIRVVEQTLGESDLLISLALSAKEIGLACETQNIAMERIAQVLQIRYHVLPLDEDGTANDKEASA